MGKLSYAQIIKSSKANPSQVKPIQFNPIQSNSIQVSSDAQNDFNQFITKHSGIFQFVIYTCFTFIIFIVK